MPTNPLPAKPSARRRRGRPRNDLADAAILEAAEALLLEGGTEALTMNAVVARSGVSRATAYRRWASREALVTAVLRRAIGQPVFAPQGSALESIHSAVEYMREALSRPAVRSMLPDLIGALLRDAPDGDRVTFEALLPGMPRFVESYRRGAPESGLRSDVDADVVGDLLFGVMLVGTLRNGLAPDAAGAQQIMDVLLNGLRPRTDEPG